MQVNYLLHIIVKLLMIQCVKDKKKSKQRDNILTRHRRLLKQQSDVFIIFLLKFDSFHNSEYWNICYVIIFFTKYRYIEYQFIDTLAPRNIYFKVLK